ncbi:peptidase M19 [Aggregatimonas sangjinii]|uniref:Peptidase M19 n=1 Tax=Aggregatimonas sangjinii TaxID=2583587 RepID=A0A5B7SNE2_9FLAO|nr:membrane dipeptidase [Aggregatimonas sangjinii]QCX00037.1 peptidase M19 [Aggregatimonas sangjinii]
MKNVYIDLHCHPSLKPFGRSFDQKSTKKRNSPNRMRRNSIYHRKGVNPVSKKINNLLTLTKFTQSDLTSVYGGKGRILVISLYPMEKQMVHDTGDVKFIGRLFRNLATGIGIDRIRHIQKMTDYFEDLNNEYEFYKELDNKPVTVHGKKVRYKMVKSYQEIEQWKADGIPTIFMITSIEGCHVFNSGLVLAGRPKADEKEVLENIKIVKNWTFRPFFVGLAHHFDNELCGHEKSMGGLVDAIIKQKVDNSQGITSLGKKALSALLDNNKKNRILIDVKHMNVKSRYEYYEIVKSEYASKIPLIVSHGAVNGRNNPIDNNRVDTDFNDATINFYDDEIFRIARSQGIFGIQLDERRIAHKKVMGLLAGRNKSSKLIWKQIEHMAKYLNLLKMEAWNIQCLGTDFDGIIDPLPGFWAAKDLDKLPKFLVKHANDFLKSPEGKKLEPKNRLSAKEIVDKFMFGNARDFLKAHFR